MPATPEYLERNLRNFAGFCAGASPLYASLSGHVALDADVLALATVGQDRQPPANLLFGAVHDLLLAGRRHPLRDHYPSVGGTAGPNGAYTPFRDFCLTYADELRERISTRRVQTNEVGRCGLLLPAFALAWQQAGRRPLFMLELGASAGLNLHFDQYAYEWSRDNDGEGQTLGSSHARVRTETRGGAGPLPAAFPPVAGRIGVDLAPVDVTDADAIRWVEAMIWADMTERLELFRAAVAHARRRPPDIRRGDGLALLPELIRVAPPDTVPCVYHSHAIYQMDATWRTEFRTMLHEAARSRDLAWVSLEWLKDDPCPRLDLTVFRDGVGETRWLANGHHHGAWIEWRESPMAAPPDFPAGRG
ncbi:MAG: DUF2332 domain-containing protein [Phycisphaerales bacterium]|nr:DUF2332 domain-containing protein [Phycisphaerae bacterium]NNM24881.1 DUF2332 domain-containing protein [Phycisphaerales bacterium]